ncbi:energy transducer TonB [Pseudomonas sp. T1.Ur]|uniref:energy transducer TonB n=1 Tax=Pseudomonas sp. T1.Ur TaxID=2928704 RepID=UPI00201D9704|nr:energy transducer TonB [Pseudomonas sp. T1.Ur]MCL6701903.1 TonB family protein [Pseudomonas sp. T1.Ur]
MTAMIMHGSSTGWPALGRDGFWRNGLAAGGAVALHAAVVVLLAAGWTVETPPVEAPRVLRTQLVILPPAPVPQAPAPVAVTAPQPIEAPAPPVEAPRPKPIETTPDPQLQARKLEQAAVARKRVEERKREQQADEQRQRLENERRRHEAEQQAAEQQVVEQHRQAQQAEALAQQRRAEQARLAADSRSYLPLSKEAPDYPQRALDKGLEGDCTVEYSVTPEGKIENPKVLNGCHPLFIRPSLAAAQAFRYQPRIVDGRAVTVPAVRNTFHYRIK